ncbi:DNA methylase [Roseivivax halodurans JCM 10272]|uniref:DNA-directed DNA polymerase n=1 Tax=Roseivivax halodurans JCM 10272 TaxID=1449350 RepID=X7ECF1_9RHOB|nr:DNA polymerase Y family protein [Roseivivax halodurans]ETX13769.1 DNA methylase [Roseivivax halodurans JCM 10272]
MTNRRILSLWFPRLGAEQAMRLDPGLESVPFALVREEGNAQFLSSLSLAASEAGLYRGQPLRDAHAVCADLVTRPEAPHRIAAFLNTLHRWAGKFSPWVAPEAPEALVIDLTGCAHLFGGETALLAQVEQDCADLHLTVRAGIADTLGAAWALARYAGSGAASHRSGDAIDQEARATRARAGKRRHWERGGATPVHTGSRAAAARIAAPGTARSALGPLPVAALRLPPETVEALARLGLRRIGDLTGQPRATLARRFGTGLVLRLDQATGAAPEPISPATAPERFAVRMTLPDPIGLEEDVMAALSCMLPRLCQRLERAGRGARTLRLEAHRTDQSMEWRHVGLARPSAAEDRLRTLLAMKAAEIDAGFGIDMLRLEALVHEPLQLRDKIGHLEAGRAVAERLRAGGGIDDLIGRLGARLGMEAITRVHPAESHIPEKGATVLAAAWSDPAIFWPRRPRPRPLMLWRPEPLIGTGDSPALPRRIRWRGRDLALAWGEGPERIAPEWWLDDPDWRSGQRDYWRVQTDAGDRLWLYYAHGAAMSPGWFCHGAFA